MDVKGTALAGYPGSRILEAEKMVTTVFVKELPPCDFCRVQAEYDGKTKMGPWASMCAECFREHGIGLGTGRGQHLRLGADEAYRAGLRRQ